VRPAGHGDAQLEAAVAEFDDRAAADRAADVRPMVDQHRRARTELGEADGTVGTDRDDRVVGLDRRVAEHQRTAPGAADEVAARSQRDGVPGVGPGGDGDAHMRVWAPRWPNRNGRGELSEKVR
jgi:hypothetical protein